MIRKFVLVFLASIPLIAGTNQSYAQSAYVPLHSEESYLLDRLETKSGILSPYFFGFRATSRKDAMEFISDQRMNMIQGELGLSEVDKFNIKRAESINSEWVETSDGLDAAIPSRRPVLRYLYEVQPDAIHINSDGLFLVVNPVFYGVGSKEVGENGFGYINTRGVEIRGRVAGRIGFYSMFADNQEKLPTYVSAFEKKFTALPGRALYVENSPGNYDMFLGKGYVDAALFNDFLNVTFGYDNHFTGVGMRSLFLSDFTPPGMFLRLASNLDRFSYQSLFMQLTADRAVGPYEGDHRFSQKYAALHQLGYQPNHWLQIGLFESTIFGRVNKLRVTDLIPIIGYQSLAEALGANQKTALGLYGKAIARNHFQFYTQAYFDRLNFSQLGSDGWWGNQVGFQLGAKYFDMLNVRNLDLQIEGNIVRPFTYGSDDGTKDYTDYNLPLAHPYGAGFAEVVAQIRYQPVRKLYIDAKAVYAQRGADTTAAGNVNGINPMDFANNRAGDNGYGWIPGNPRTSLYLNLNIAYEIRPNIFLEAGAYNMRYWQTGNLATDLNNSMNIYGGIRWNITKRAFDVY